MKIGLLLAFILFIFCVYQLNAYTEEMYLIEGNKIEIEKLSKENKILEVNFSREESLENAGSFVENRNFEKAEGVEYIRVLESTALAR